MKRVIKDIFNVLTIISSVIFLISVVILLTTNYEDINYIVAEVIKYNMFILPVITLITCSANLASSNK